MKIVCDIDGVLACVKDYVEKYLPHDWKGYFSHTLEFPVIWQTLFLLDALVSNYTNTKLYLATGRPESNRILTEVWLNTHLSNQPTKLFMRSNKDHRPASEIKLEWLLNLKPDLVIDDDPELVVAATKAGFTVLQVHGYRSTPHDLIPTDHLELGGKY